MHREKSLFGRDSFYSTRLLANRIPHLERLLKRAKEADISMENSRFRPECDEKIAASVRPRAYAFDARAGPASVLTKTARKRLPRERVTGLT